MDSTLKLKIKKRLRNPFPESRSHLIIQCAHHKVGTVWFERVLKAIASHYGLPFIKSVIRAIPPAGPRVYVDDHSKIDLSELTQPYRGSHMIRDPRDMVVSGYHYHLWTDEPWANTKISEFGPDISNYWPLLPVNDISHLSYKEYLNSLDREDGLMAEIQRASSVDIRDVMTWNYEDENILNFKYEDIMQDEEGTFRKIFSFYGFKEEAVSYCTRKAMEFSFSRQTENDDGKVNEKTHLRSGKLEQWRTEFSDSHKDYFKKLHGQDLIELGYESNFDW